MKTFDLPLAKCFVCGEMLGRSATKMSHGPSQAPAPGDLAMCEGCGELLMFGPGMEIEIPSVAVLLRIDPELSRIIDATQKAIRKNR